MKKTFLIEECQMALMKSTVEDVSDEITESAHRQYAGMPKMQASLDLF